MLLQVPAEVEYKNGGDDSIMRKYPGIVRESNTHSNAEVFLSCVRWIPTVSS